MFILILTPLWLGSIFGWFNAEIPGWIKSLFTLCGFYYVYKAQRNFYGQGRGKTILKYLLHLLLLLFVMIILFAVFLIFSTFVI